MSDRKRNNCRAVKGALAAGFMCGLAALLARRAPAQNVRKQSVQYREHPKTVIGTEH